MIISGVNLSKSYKTVKALQGVSIDCSAGEILGIVGANGSGKSTLFKILLGVMKPDTGTVTINSNSVKPVGGIIEKPALYEYLNAYENLRVFASIQGLSADKAFLTKSLINVGLPINRKDPVKNFSMGMKQRLGIAIALLNNPDCLILDEPFSGLDPMGIASLKTLITTLAEKERLAVLMSSHILDELNKICHRLAVIKNGKVIKTGTTAEIIYQSTKNYAIAGTNLDESTILKSYNASFRDNLAIVKISSENISELIQKLGEENIKITSFAPEISMNELFEN
ncbi:ABC transporter ATP-binding protein [Algibacter mikhailovii]|uniref:ABC transporter ATP-binding protein YdbJ n=1 Tax=Algibacter mikhailovii TaxID=425498 RepID=A0A918QYI9_9FLAO|nr:ABC transporter ATP-binding protein [Algibacter mikhailovii]GGZ74581.1 putative ABC transporter ATP-binding protein YdbJ [Algibacter mikhailovii]